MKKIYSIILAFLLSVLSLTSCSEDLPLDGSTLDELPSEITLLQEYSILQVGGYDFRSGVRYTADIDLLSSGVFNNESAKKNRSVNINNDTFKGEYVDSYNDKLYNGIIDRYKSETDEYNIKFGINSATGKCVSYSNLSYFRSSDEEKDEQECFDIAFSLLASLVDQVENYTYIGQSFNPGFSFGDVYYFKWTRYVGSIATMENVAIGVTVYGDIINYMLSHIGDMANVPPISEEILSTVESSVYTRLEENYASVKDQYVSIEHTSPQIKLIRITDGRLALEYLVDTGLEPVNESQVSFFETNHFIIPLE